MFVFRPSVRHLSMPFSIHKHVHLPPLKSSLQQTIRSSSHHQALLPDYPTFTTVITHPKTEGTQKSPVFAAAWAHVAASASPAQRDRSSALGSSQQRCYQASSKARDRFPISCTLSCPFGAGVPGTHGRVSCTERVNTAAPKFTTASTGSRAAARRSEPGEGRAGASTATAAGAEDPGPQQRE